MRSRAPRPPGKRKPARVGPKAPADAPFPIVGIGASAGGLEALEQFLRHVPAGSGMAFVIVQHLDPTHKGIMPELLQRATAMPVNQVKDRTRVQPDCVYVIPPNKDLSILRGVLHLLAPTASRGLRLPIDFFFRSLAADQQDHAVGIILSGMGTDGTLGLRAIKEKAGLVLVQAPASAKFDSMPRSAIDAGLADFVGPVEELPGKLLASVRHAPLVPAPGIPLEARTQSALEKIVILLRASTGQDFSHYKKSTVYRRIERRMGLHQADKIGTYVQYLQENPQELELLFKELLIGVTSFFRDPAAWEQLKAHGIPAILARRRAGQALRAWVPGCSTGEEAYSLAMVFKEVLAQRKTTDAYSLQIFATDLDRDAIDRARQSIFPDNIAADVSPERLKRFFIKDDRGFRIRREIREMVTFAQQNVLMDPPFTKLDILSCRNLLIYLDPELQRKLIPLFYYSLNPGGILFLGNAESVGHASGLFAPLGVKARLYRRNESTLLPEPVELPAAFVRGAPEASEVHRAPIPPVSLQGLADQLILQRYAPATVLVNDQGDILYISGRTGKYLEPAAGRVNWNVLAMAREGLRVELAATLRKALRQKEPVTLRHVKVRTNGGEQIVNVTVQPLEEPEALRGMGIVVFSDVPAVPTPKAPGRASRSSRRSVTLATVERELERARDEARIIREEMQTSQEELKSTNEELQSTNEELQSTNEELTTSKEEMQSLNEELQTVNAELQTKVDELSQSNNDMLNLLNSTDIATVFLDGALHIRRFTARATSLIKLIPGDVGRPVTDLACDLLYQGLPEDAREVLRTLRVCEKEIAIEDGRWFLVRILPYRTSEDRIDGVVLTFTEITIAKAQEAELRKALAERQRDHADG